MFYSAVGYIDYIHLSLRFARESPLARSQITGMDVGYHYLTHKREEKVMMESLLVGFERVLFCNGVYRLYTALLAFAREGLLARSLVLR